MASLVPARGLSEDPAGQAPPCNGLRTVEDFLGCTALCGYGAACDMERSPLALQYLEQEGKVLYEIPSPDFSFYPWGHVCSASRALPWEFDNLTGEDSILVRQMPSAVAGTDPPASARITSSPDGEAPESITLFLHAFSLSWPCVMEFGVVARWRPFEGSPGCDGLVANLDVRMMELGRTGGCGDMWGFGYYDGWRSGLMIDLGSLSSWECQQELCWEDGCCTDLCRVDYDCPCHNDGVCDWESCIGDRDCLCIADGHCVPGCLHDPDCACARNGRCNQHCLTLDPDCPCEDDGVCSCDCLAADPDCGCFPDGSCAWDPCGWFDDDCVGLDPPVEE